MRSMTTFLLVLLLSLSALAARKHADRTGSISEGTYTDSDYGFKITAYKDWKGTPGKEGDFCRLILIDKNLGEEFERHGGTDSYYLAALSKLEIWVLPTQDSVRDIITRLVADSSSDPMHRRYLEAVKSNEASAKLEKISDPRWKDTPLHSRRVCYWDAVYHYKLTADDGREITLDVVVQVMAIKFKNFTMIVLMSYDPVFGRQMHEETGVMLESLLAPDGQ